MCAFALTDWPTPHLRAHGKGGGTTALDAACFMFFVLCFARFSSLLFRFFIIHGQRYLSLLLFSLLLLLQFIVSPSPHSLPPVPILVPPVQFTNVHSCPFEPMHKHSS